MIVSDTLERCIRITAVHEFGHALGSHTNKTVQINQRIVTDRAAR